MLHTLQFFSLIISFFACAVGLLALLLPKKMSKGFGIPIEGTALGYITALGIRDLFIGFVILALYTHSQWQLIGLTSLLISGVAVSDFYTVFTKGDPKTAFVHFLGALAAATHGLLLLHFINL